jgi:hypothetical protein
VSIQARQHLVSRLVFQSASQRADLLDLGKTQTQLIALLIGLADRGHIMEITAVRSDHHDDSALGLHCHANGYCVDLWPLTSPTPGSYLDASDPSFQDFLRDAAASPWLYQIGLVGDGADSAENFRAAGPTAFQDDGGAHVHLGANGP